MVARVKPSTSVIPETVSLLLVSADPALHHQHGRALRQAGFAVAPALALPAVVTGHGLVVCDLCAAPALAAWLAQPQMPLLCLLPAAMPAPDWLALAGPLTDCLAMPCSSTELLARIRRLLRVAREAAGPTAAPGPDAASAAAFYWFAGNELDTRRRMLRRADGHDVALSGAEFALLLTLLRYPDQVLERRLLARWLALAQPAGSSSDPGADTLRRIDALVRRLRAKLEPAPGRPSLILASHGRGYRLAATVRQG